MRIIDMPPMDEIPEIFRGRKLVVVNGCVNADDATARKILAPLRDLRPEVDTFDRVPTSALVRLHMDPEGPTPAVSATAILGELPAEAIEAFIAAGPRPGSPLLLSELRQLGGAASRPAADCGAKSHLEGQFLFFTVAITPTPEAVTAGQLDADRFVEALQPWAHGRQYLNFVEQATGTPSGFDASAYARLQAIRARVDPDGVLVANHRIALPTEQSDPSDQSDPSLPAQR